MIRLTNAISGVLALLALAVATSGQSPTLFTYQGRLMDGTSAANGAYTMEFSLWDGPSAAATLIAGPLIQSGVVVTEGLFATQLDFGAAPFNTDGDRWLGITINGITLVPRQPITRAPFAMRTRGISVDPAERVGVGTPFASAETELHVQANTNDNFALLCDAFSVAGTEIGLHTSATSYASLAKNAFYAPGWLRFNNTNGAFLQEIDPNGNVRFHVAGPAPGFISWNTALYLQADGKVGIGTTTPAGHARFHVVKTTDYGTAALGSHETNGIGVEGLSMSGFGVLGLGAGLSGYNVGVYGDTNSPDGWAGYFNGRGYFATLFVGRDYAITGQEYFGVHAPVNSGYGGMYVSTQGPTAAPFYGNSAGATAADMWHYYDGSTGDWTVFNGGNRLTVESGGQVGIGTTDPAFLLHVNGSAGKPGGGSWSNSSDIRLKKNIRDLDGA